MMPDRKNIRRARLVRDSFIVAMSDAKGIKAAYESGRQYAVELTGLSFRSLSSAFQSVVNLLDPPRYLEYFDDSDILENPAFQAFRDMLNEAGLDMDTDHGYYRPIIENKRVTSGVSTPSVRFYIVPWDGVKKGFEPYDYFEVHPPIKRVLYF